MVPHWEGPDPVIPVDPPDGTIDVRAFGARGDGRSDDAPAIQAAVDAGADFGTVLLCGGNQAQEGPGGL